MSSYTLIVLLLSLFTTCSSNRMAPPAGPAGRVSERPDDGAGVTADEYDVYSSAISRLLEKHRSSSVVILERTEDVSDPHSVTSEWVHRCETLPGGGQRVTDDFRDSNQRPVELRRNFNLGVEYKLISHDELKTIPEERMRLEGYRAKYPDSYGVISLSRVGFNEDKTQALLYISQISCGSGCGEGICMLLAKENSAWKVMAERLSWIS